MHSNIVGYTPKIESRIRPREIASNVTRYLAVDKDIVCECAVKINLTCIFTLLFHLVHV